MEHSTISQSNREQSPKGAATVEVAVTPSPPRNTLQEFERLFGVDEDVFEQPTTTRKELWAYYLYYNGLSARIIQLWLYIEKISMTDSIFSNYR